MLGSEGVWKLRRLGAAGCWGRGTWDSRCVGNTMCGSQSICGCLGAWVCGLFGPLCLGSRFAGFERCGVSRGVGEGTFGTS